MNKNLEWKEQFKIEITGTLQEIIELLNRLYDDIKVIKEIEIENCEHNEKCKEYLKELKK